MEKLFFIFIALFSLTSCNPYIINALVYNDPGIREFRHFPYRAVRATNPQPHPIVASGIEPLLSNDSLVKLLKSTGSVSFMVFRKDSLLIDWHISEKKRNQRTNPFSATKSVINILVGIAIREGKIKNVEEPIANYYAPYRKEGLEKITFKDLLYMSSGLNYYDDINPAGQLAKLFYGNDIQKLVNSLKAEVPPSTQFRYKNVDPEIIGFALQEAVGMSVSEYASQKLWSVIGAESDALWSIDKKKTGMEKTFCCMNTTAQDLVRIGLLYKHKGNWKGTQIVDTSYVNWSVKPHHIPKPNGTPTNNYAALWWYRNIDNKGDYTADGLKGQYVSIIADEDIVFVRFGKRDYAHHKDKNEVDNCPQLYAKLVRIVRSRWGKQK